jgi:hypothetical protein
MVAFNELKENNKPIGRLLLFLHSIHAEEYLLASLLHSYTGDSHFRVVSSV